MRWKTRYIRAKRYSRKLIKWTSFFALFLLVIGYVVFKSSYVQTYLTQRLSSYFSEKTGTSISVGEVDFRPFDTFVLKDLLILDHREDTLLHSNDFYFEINDYDFEKLQFNFDLLELNDGYVNIVTYAGETESSLEVFVNKISTGNSNELVSPQVYIEDIAFENLRLRNWDENSLAEIRQFDFSHLNLYEVNMDADDFIYKEDLIRINTELFEFKDKSGFELLGMAGSLMMDDKNLLLKYFEFETNETDINGDISMEYESFDSFDNFLEEVYFDTYFEETRVSSNDVAYFTDAVDGLNRSITFQGDIKGTVSTLQAKNLKFRYGKETHFEGEMEFENLGISSDPTINAKISHLVTFEEDIKDIPLPPFKSGNRIRTPKWMSNVGKMEFKGDFIGPTSNFEALGVLTTSAGVITSDVFFKSDTARDETRIVGNVETTEFNLGQTIGNPEFGLLSMKGKLDALAQFENNRLIFSGEIPRIDYRNYSYSNINMNGTVRDQIFNGQLSVHDPNLVFDFEGSVDFSIPNQQKYDFDAELLKANVKQINWSSRDSSTTVRGGLVVNLVGNGFEDLDGTLKLNNLRWFENGKSYKIKNVNLTAVKEKNREMIKLDSDLLSGKIEGNYNLGEIYPTIINVFSKEVPSLISEIETKNYKGGNKFNVMLRLHEYSMINELFTPSLKLAQRTRFSGRFDDIKKSFSVHFASDSVVTNNRLIKGIKLYGNNKNDKLNILGKTKFLQVVNNLGVENLKLNSTIVNNLVSYKVGYRNDGDASTYGDITGELDLNKLDTIKLGINESSIVYRDSVWKIDTTSFVSISKNHIDIKNFNLFASKNQFLKIHGIASDKNTDSLLVDMNNFQLAGLQYFWNYINLDVSGNATGSFKLNSAFNEKIFTSDIGILGMTLNKQTFGKVKLKTDFEQSNGIIGVKLDIDTKSKKNRYKNVSVSGNYYPYENGRIDMKANFLNTQLKFMEKYFEGVLSDFRGGKASGELDITGTISHPLMDGNIKIDHLRFGVDYLNTKYNIDAQNLKFNKDFIYFKDFELSHEDYVKSKAKVNGVVDLDGFGNITYNLDSVVLEEFFCLNTTVNENATYYGKAFVNGLVKLKGDETSNFIGGTVTTTKTIKKERIPVNKDGKKFKVVETTEFTELELPLDQNEDLEISEFVSFVNLSDTTSKKKLIEEDFDLTGLDLDFNFRITPDARVKIIFDPAVGDEINAKGTGTIGMNINTNGKFSMYGDYAVTEGSYYFTLQNIIGKRFVVEPGSKISWDGDPLDATMAMKTYYKSRANLIDLVDSNIVSDYELLATKFDNRIQVNSNLGLFGSLWKPELKIGISLPNGTADEKNFMQDYIYGEDEINRQAFSLILTSQFLPPSGGVESIVSNNAGLHNGMQFVEGQINNALSGLLHPNLDLGVDYNDVEGSGNEENLTKDELRLLAGFKYKNLSLRTDFDINNQVGDIEAEFKITEALKAKAYHKTVNDATTLNNQTTTTYGLGAAYQKSFNSFGDLFRRKEEN